MNQSDNYKISDQKRNEHTREFIRMYFPKSYNFSVSGVLSNCPYTLNQLRFKDRDQDRVYWRNMAMICYFMNGYNVKDSALKLNRHHSTLIHAIDQVYLARKKHINGRRSDFNDVIEKILNTVDHNIIETTDINVNEAISLAHSESKFFERYPELRS